MLHSLVFSYRWEFQTEDYDIAFGVLRKSSGDKKKEDEEGKCWRIKEKDLVEYLKISEL